MFEISVEYAFAAGHALRGYKGKCENVHGHNYKVGVTVAGDQLNSIGLLMDFAAPAPSPRSARRGFDSLGN
ncbi:MAG: hypothetical protein DMG23_14825 [Acidobacteria bacterium]|nr:MAG: hypothetical protein DMG23_14825 [Acidobacteriota bacterium]